MSNDKIADLKAKFVTGAIPLDSDYATLLNMLEETRAATGTSPESPKSASLKLSNEGFLDVAVAPDGGVVTGDSGLSTDARVLWAKNHAIATGATQYAIWSHSYIFIYVLPEAGKRKVQFLDIAGGQYVSNFTEKGFMNLYTSSNPHVADVDGYDTGAKEPVDGWVDRRNNGYYNTLYFSSNETSWSRITFAAGPEEHQHEVYWYTTTLFTV